MRAEVYRREDPETVVAVATWSAGAMDLDVRDASLKGLDGLLRPTAVVVEDASLRQLGTHGASLLQPGSLEWFRAALWSRTDPLGLAVRFVTEEVRGGWDPASNYRTFADQASRIASSN